MMLTSQSCGGIFNNKKKNTGRMRGGITFLSFFLLLSYLWWVSHVQFLSLTPPAPSSNNIKTIFILAGQSNMAGRGGVVNNTWDGFVPPKSQPNPSVFRLSAAMTWEEARESLHADIDVNKTCGVGPGMAFANAILEREAGLGGVGLVPCAVGGTQIREWARGSRLYEEMIKRARVSVEEGGGEIRGILWYQGERDTVREEDAEVYKQNFENFILHLRSDLGSPFIPVFQVVLASGQGPYMKKVREAQLKIEVPNVISVDAMGLLLEPDGLHLTTQAQVSLGEMLAQAFLQTIHNAPITRYSLLSF